MDILQIQGLCKRFGDKEVLRGVDLTVPEKRVFGFVGKNGAGKTTTMKLILGLLKPDAGEISVAGERVAYGRTSGRAPIGYLPDVPEFYSFMTAEEYLSLCGELAGMSATERRRRGGELLSLVGLSGEKHRIRGYSRGMKQRLGIAQALLGKPCLLLCDEPTSALDPLGRKEILDILAAIKEETTVLFSTHILSDVEKICTDVAFLQEGRVAVEGCLEDIRRRYRKDEYRIEMERPEDAARLLAVFSCLQREDDGCLRLCQTGEELFSVLSFIAENQLSLVRTERCEPTLEALFEEVVQR